MLGRIGELLLIGAQKVKHYYRIFTQIKVVFKLKEPQFLCKISVGYPTEVELSFFYNFVGKSYLDQQVAVQLRFLPKSFC